ncbi:hypothetical protein [Bacillus kexueae]|uniref:hypothetical protein n=1 Tax=Aeribacillus kexueae TaxID=2078952 RepID=UPI001FAEB009|nr:hypothetical protein [Bacillus kexueae]
MTNYINDTFINNPVFKTIYSLLLYISNQFDNFIIILLLQYFVLYTILKISLFIIGKLISNLNENIKKGYKKLVRGRKITTVKILSEVYYLIDRNLTIISYNAFPCFNKNILKSPISILRALKNFLITPFKFTLSNILIWITLLTYFKYDFFSDTKLESILSTLSEIDYKYVNTLLNTTLILISFIIIIVFRSPHIQASAKKTAYEEMFKVVFFQQSIITSNLSKILYKYNKNINLLEKNIDYLTQSFCREISDNKYVWINKKLEKNDRGRNFRFSCKELFSDFECFKEEYNKIWESLLEINTYKFQKVFFEINKKSIFELIELGIYPESKKDPDTFLINKSSLERIYNNHIKNYSYIQSYFQESLDYQNPEESFKNTTNLAFLSYEKNLKIKEVELENAILSFRIDLELLIEESIYNYIIASQLLIYLENKSVLKLKDWLLTK